MPRDDLPLALYSPPPNPPSSMAQLVASTPALAVGLPHCRRALVHPEQWSAMHQLVRGGITFCVGFRLGL